jgi:regulatory protein
LESDRICKKALGNAYALLRQRPRSEHEIRERLKLKGYAADAIEGCVETLRLAGEIDDTRFARLWVESRMRRNPMGDVVLRHELKAKGVDEAIITEALAEKAKAFDEYAVALNMARERFRQLAKLDRKKAMKRLYDFLVRRGFKFDMVERVIEELVR